MRHFILILLFGLVCQAKASDVSTMVTAYAHYLLAEETLAHAESLGKEQPVESARQINQLASDWRTQQLKVIRQQLVAQLGEEANTRFNQFISQYSAAAEADDKAYLTDLVFTLKLDAIPATYAELYQMILANKLPDETESAVDLLSNIEIWTMLNDTGETLPLDVWLSRNATQEARVVQKPKAPQRPANPLRAAEAPMTEFTPPEEQSANMLDVMSDLRHERRAKALEQAQAGMQQVASERQAWEQEAAARESAKAQAEAEAMIAQAQKLAATEAEALEQSQNTWGNRLKRIAGATVSTTVGAFTGGIGTVAADRAIQEIFN